MKRTPPRRVSNWFRFVAALALSALSSGVAVTHGEAKSRVHSDSPFALADAKPKFSGVRPLTNATLLLDDFPCEQYLLPPEDCQTNSDGTVDGGDANDTDGSLGTVWPNGFGIFGTYLGNGVVGYATHSSGDTYYFFAAGADCTIFGTIHLSILQAIGIDLGISVTLSDWWVSEEYDCD